MDDLAIYLFILKKVWWYYGIISINTDNYHCFDHSCDGRNPGDSYEYWIPARAGMTSQWDIINFAIVF